MSNTEFCGITFIVPCYNEAKRLNLDYWKGLFSCAKEMEWIFIDDGSSDNTLELLNQLKKYPSAQILKLNKNSGKAEAVRVGILKAIQIFPLSSGFGFMDADNAFSIEDVCKISQIFENSRKNSSNNGFDTVISSRVGLAGRDIKRTMYRHYLGRIISTLVLWSWEGAPYDSQSGFKIFANTVHLKNSLKESFKTRWFVDLEIMVRYSQSKGKILTIWEEPVCSWRDVAGSKIKTKEFFRILLEMRFISGFIRKFVDELVTKEVKK